METPAEVRIKVLVPLSVGWSKKSFEDEMSWDEFLEDVVINPEPHKIMSWFFGGTEEAIIHYDTLAYLCQTKASEINPEVETYIEQGEEMVLIVKQKETPSRFKQFRAGTIYGLGSFESSLYDLFYKADQGNRERLVDAYKGKYFNEDDVNF